MTVKKNGVEKHLVLKLLHLDHHRSSIHCKVRWFGHHFYLFVAAKNEFDKWGSWYILNKTTNSNDIGSPWLFTAWVLLALFERMTITPYTASFLFPVTKGAVLGFNFSTHSCLTYGWCNFSILQLSAQIMNHQLL